MDAEESHAFIARWVEAAAIVLNGQTQSGGVLAHGHLDVVRAGVLDAVVERFLGDAVDAGLVVFRKVFGNRGGVDGDPDAAALRDFAGLPLEGGREAEVVEHGGAKQQRHIADHADGGFKQLLDLGGLGGERRGIVVADERGEIRHFDQDAGERLAHLIVKLA